MKQQLTLCCIFLAIGLNAQTIFVKQNASGANNGTSWQDAYTSLESALSLILPGQSIWVAAGTYKPENPAPNNSFHVAADISLYGGFSGTETTISQRNIAANPTILSGDILGDDVPGNFAINRTDNAEHVLIGLVLVENTGLVIDGFTIRGGHTAVGTGSTQYTHSGGGLLINAKGAILNCTFTDNYGEAGAAIAAIDNLSDNILVNKCLFERNEATEQGIVVLSNTPTGVIKNCTFRSNKTNRGALYPVNTVNMVIDSCLFERNASVGYGGGMFTWQSTYSLTNCTFLKNKATNAAGVYIDNRNGGDLATIKNCVFEADSTTDYGGTAIFGWYANMTVNECLFKNNVAPSSGSAFYNGEGSTFLIKDCVIEGNKGNYAAAVANYGVGCVGTYESCTFRNNLAQNGGGAASNGFKADVKYKNCEFISNGANFGGAIFTQNDTTRLEVEGCNFVENYASGNAGAIYVNVDIAAKISTSIFYQNNAATGGAIHAIGDSLLTLNKCAFLENISTSQGAAVNFNHVNSIITNSLFAKNYNSGAAGGAISSNAAADQVSKVTAVNCTFADNVAAIGAGIAQWEDPTSTTASAQLTLLNCLFQNPEGENYTIEEGTPDVVSMNGNQSSDQSLEAYLQESKDLHNTTNEFLDASGFDYAHLISSAASNGGVSEGAPLDDIIGVSRAGIPDVGYREIQITGIQDVDYQIFTLECSPNPAKDWMAVSFKNDYLGLIDLSIWSLEGQQVLRIEAEKTAEKFSSTINVSQLAAGAYKVRAQIGKTMHRGVLIKI